MLPTRRAASLASALVAAGVVLAAQQPAEPAKAPSLAGLWQFDEDRTSEDQRN